MVTSVRAKRAPNKAATVLEKTAPTLAPPKEANPAASASKKRQGQPAANPAPPEEPKKRVKLVRDSFTMPRNDFDLIAALKARALKRQRVIKKSELLRAGLHVLNELGDTALLQAVDRLTPLPLGRPKNTR